MRKRSLALVAAIGLLGGAAQVDAHGGGFIGGAFHGGGPHGMGPHGVPPLITTHGPGSIAPLPPHDGPAYAVAPTDRANEGVRHDFHEDAGFRRDGDFHADDHRFGAPGYRVGFPGGAINFAPRPPSRATPVLYNYYYGGTDNYYSNVVSTYGVPYDPCPGCSR